MKSDNTAMPAPKIRWRRRLLLSILGVIALLILMIALLPTLLSTAPARRLVMTRINGAMEGQAEVGQWSWRWTRGIHIRDLRFQDSLGLTRFTVKGIQVRPTLRSLLSGRLALRQAIIDRPTVTLVNMKRDTGQAPLPSESKKSQDLGYVPGLPISHLDMEIRDAVVEVVDDWQRTTTLAEINSQVSFDAAQGRGGLSLDMAVAGAEAPGSVKADVALEKVKWAEWSFKETSGSVTVDVNALALESLETLLQLGGVDIDLQGVTSAQLAGEIRQGQVESLMGTLNARNVDVSGPDFSGDRLASQTLDVRLDARRQGQQMKVNSLSLACDWLEADVQGTMPAEPARLSLSDPSQSGFALKGDFDLDVAQLASQLPHRLSLKDKTKLTQGRATGRFDLASAQMGAEFRLDDLAGQVDQTQVRLSEPIQGTVRLSTQGKGTYRVEDLSLTSSFARVRAKGNSERVEFNEWLDLEKMQTELGQFLDIGDYTFKGQLSGEGVAYLGDRAVALAGTAVLKNLDLAVPDGNAISETQVELIYDTAYDWDQGLLRLAGLNARADWGELGLQDARFQFKPAQAKAQVSVKALQLQRLLPYAQIFSAIPSGLQTRGLAQADIGWEMNEGEIRIVTNNTLIEQFELELPGKKPFEQPSIALALQARINPADKAINVETFQLTSPQIKVTKAQFQRHTQAEMTRVETTAECEYDLQAVGEWVAALVPTGLDMAGKRTGHLSFTSTYPSAQPQALWRSAQGQARFGFDRATYQGLNFGPTDVNAVFAQGVLQIEPFETTVNQGQLSLACQTDFRQRPVQVVMPEPRQIAQGIHLTPETTQTLFRYVNPIFANLSDVEGKVNFFCEKLVLPLDPNAQEQIELVGTLSMDDIYLQGSGLLNEILAGLDLKNLRRQRMKMHPTKLVLRGGVLQYDDMQIDVGDNPVNFSGAIGLDETLDMRVKTPYTARGKTVRVGDPDQGQRVTVTLSGTLDRPIIDMDSVLDQLLQMGIQRGLEELFKL